MRKFLEQKFDLKWLGQANFEKNNNSTLRISYRSKRVLITLNTMSTKAVVEIKEETKKKRYEFVVESLPNGLNIMALDKPIEELEALSLQAAI
ncbi:MAG TPA: hypothetical protein VJ729_11755 [Nitrososphaeraceae archaeon]|nr:hypothetical protein [Nitrososphaeraceae archaeon]